MDASTAMNLQEERKLYLSMVYKAIAEEGSDSWQAQLARTFLEDVEADLLKISMQYAPPSHDVRNFCQLDSSIGQTGQY